jgi:glycerol uptake facilitator-like aquaporin
MKKYFAEGLGAGVLTLVVALSLSVRFPVSTPVLAGLVLGLFVYSIGHISGTHINPAVTVGVWSLNKISGRDAIFYIVSQAIGALLAMILVTKTVGLASLTVSNSGMVFLAEALGTFFFTFGIASVVLEKTHSHMSGLVIGGSLLLGITIAATLGSNGVLNPAVAWGIGSLNLMYVLGPIVGSIFGMQAYKYLSK